MRAPYSLSGASTSRKPTLSDTQILRCLYYDLRCSTDDEFSAYVSENWFPGISDAELSTLLTLYPSDPAAGSPFGTGDNNTFTPEYKRIAALQGDWIFQVPRRNLLEIYSNCSKTYSFRKRLPL